MADDIYEINGERYALPAGTDPSVLDEMFQAPAQQAAGGGAGVTQDEDIYEINGERYALPKGTDPSVLDELIYGQEDSQGPREFSDNPGVANRFFNSLTGSFVGGVTSIPSAARLTAASITGDEEGFDEAAATLKQKAEEASFYNPDPTSFAEVRAKYDENGVFSAVGETFDLAAQTAGSSLGFMVPALGGLAVAAYSSGPAAIAALGAGGVASFSQYYGQQLERTLGEIGEDANIEDVNIPVQMLSAGAQTALDMVAPIAAGVSKQPLAIAGKELLRKGAIRATTPAAQKALNTAAYQTVEDALKKSYGSYAGRIMTGVGLEVGTETLQTALERGAAGLSISPADQDAFDEYLEVAVGAALLGSGFSAVGEYKKGSVEQAKIDETKYKVERVVEKALADVDPNIDTVKQKIRKDLVDKQPQVGDVIEPQTPNRVKFDNDKRVVRDADSRKHYIVRDKDGNSKGIFPSLKKANKWRDAELAINPDAELRDVSLEEGFVIRAEKMGKNGKPKVRRPVGFVRKDQGDIQADQETIRLQSLEKSAKPLVSEKTRPKKQPGSFWPAPESWESVRARVAPGSQEVQPTTQVTVKGGGALKVPAHKGMGFKASEVVIPQGSVDNNGNGFGVAKFNRDFQATGKWKSWQNAASKFFTNLNTDPKFLDKKEVEHVSSENGRRDTFVWKPRGEKAPVTFVFDNYINDKGKPARVLSEVFAGKDYSSRVTKSGMAPGVSTTALIAAHGSKKKARANKKGMRKAVDRAAQNITHVEHSTRAERVINAFFDGVGKLRKDGLGRNHERFRRALIDQYDQLGKSDKASYVTKPDGTKRRMRANESAEGSVRTMESAVKIVSQVANTGFAEYQATGSDGVEGQVVVRDFELEDTATVKMYDESRKRVVDVDITSDVFSGLETGGMASIYRALMSGGNDILVEALDKYRFALRAYNIEQENKTLPPDKQRPSGMSPKEIKDGLALAKEHPEIGVANANLQLLNDKLTSFLVDTHVLTPEVAAIWSENKDYVSFFVDHEATGNPQLTQEIEDQLAAVGATSTVFNPLVYRDPAKRRKGIKGKGTVFEDAIETGFSNMVSAMQAGMQNVTAMRVIRNEVAEGTARPWKAGMVGNPVVVKQGGVDTKWQVDDELLYETLSTVEDVDLAAELRKSTIGGHAVGAALAYPGHWLREGVTRDIGFAVVNLTRDSTQAMIIHGLSPTAPFNSLNRAVKAMVDRPDAISAARHEMSRYAVVQGIDSVDASRSRSEAGKNLAKSVRESGLPDKPDSLIRTPKNVWNKLADFSSASESATREQVFEKVYEESFADLKAEGKSVTEAHNIATAEAVYQAREVLNFDRRGTSRALGILSSLAPFVNSGIQGLDILYRAGLNHRPVGASMAESHNYQKAVMRRMKVMMTLAMLAELAAFGDDEYENLREDERWNNFFIPGLGIKLPIPFQLGLLIKSPAMVLRSTLIAIADEDPARARRELGGFAGETAKQMAFVSGPTSAVPTFAKPFLETAMNKSLFHGGPIHQQYEDDMPAGERGLGRNTYIGRSIAGALDGAGISSIAAGDIDNLVRSWSGTLGYFVWNSMDTLARWGMREPSKPAPAAKDMVLLNRFVLDPDRAGLTGEMYEWAYQMRGYQQAINQQIAPGPKAEKSKKFAKEAAVSKEANNLLSARAKINKQRKAVVQHPKMGAGEKARVIRDLNNQEKKITDAYKELRKNWQM